MTELWKDVIGVEETYQVSTLGRIRSKDRTVEGRNGSIRTVKSEDIKPFISQSGRAFVSLYSNKSRRVRAIDELMYEAFIGEIPDGYRVVPIDGDILNLELDNLELDYTVAYKKWLRVNNKQE